MKRLFFALIILILSLAVSVHPAGKRTGIGFRTGYFGVPDQLLDLIMFEHPGIEGKSYSFEIRNYGAGGIRSMFSGLYSLEYSRMRGEGKWRISQDDSRIEGFGEIRQLSFTATIIMCLLPGLPIRPYIGGGIGIGYIHIISEAEHVDNLGTTIEETYEEKKIIPVGHLPVGIIFNPGNGLEIRLEGGFKNGFYFGGALSFAF